jgi:excisionase family DNA binding protein
MDLHSLNGEVKRVVAKPIYLQISQQGCEVYIKQVEFLTPEQVAELAHVKVRTVYTWIDKSRENGLKFYRAPGTRGVLFEINEVLEWVKNTV